MCRWTPFQPPLGEQKCFLIASQGEVILAEPPLLIPVLEHVDRLDEDGVGPGDLSLEGSIDLLGAGIMIERDGDMPFVGGAPVAVADGEGRNVLVLHCFAERIQLGHRLGRRPAVLVEKRLVVIE